MKPRALITGASRGIGAAVAEELASRGHPIVLNYRSNHEAAEAVAGRLRSRGATVQLAPFDVSDRERTTAVIEGLLADDEPIGVLVNNAGIARDAPLPAMKPEAWDSVLDTTLAGFYNVTRHLVMPMVRKRWGRIINITSISGISGNRGQSNYAAAKAGLIGATKSLALELAKRGITVNAVAPGLIDTEMTAEAPVDQILKLIPMRRLGQPEEVAKIVGFLASDDAAYITRQVVVIDGGLS